MKKDGPKAPTAVHGPLGITCHPNEKPNVTADCLKTKFTSNDLCDENHKRQVETRIQTLFTSVDNTLLGKIRPSDIHILANSLKLKKVCGLDGIPNECPRHLLRRPLAHLTHLFNHCLQLSYFPKPRKEATVTTLPKLSKDHKFPKNLRLPSSATGKLFKKVILKIVQTHTEERGLLNASQFSFCACHSTRLHFEDYGCQPKFQQ
jgi:hypothetical protein